MTRSLTAKQSIILGCVVALCISLGIWGLFRVAGKQSSFGEMSQIDVLVADAQGLEKGTPVQVRGMEAGQISGVEYVDDGVILHIRIAKAFRDRLRSDSSAVIKNKGLLGSNVLEIHPGSLATGPLEESMIMARPTSDLSEVTTKLNAILNDFQAGKGTLPKLIKDDSLYNELRETNAEVKKAIRNLDEGVSSMRGDAQKTLKRVDKSLDAVETEMQDFVRSGKETISAIKQDAEAIKALPIVRSYIEDSVAILVRPNCESERAVHAHSKLFEPSRSILTGEGRQVLDEVANWLNGQKVKDSEIAIASYVDPKDKELNGAAAKALSKKQAEVIVEYLKDKGVHKMGYITRRKVTPIGMGFEAPPVAEKEKVPPSRVEIILFVPRG